ncbi:MAG: tetratricopeptide repeat protein [Bryobacteraceae bacterium]|nr:tetratricopeptide repeat protein [Bryobacteraceae bacterium]
MSPIVQRDRRWLLLPAVLLALAALLYLPVTGFPFLQIDDNPHLLQEDLPRVGSGWAFQNAFAWQPLTWMSHQLDFRLFGFENAGRHHLMSLLLHLANVGLFFWWLRKLTGKNEASLAAAALFALHPLRVESVAWISGRGDLLAAFCALLALEAHRRGRWWAVIPLAGLAMMASPAAALLGLVILALDLWVLDRPVLWPETGPVLALGALALFLRATGGPDHDVLLPATPAVPFSALPGHLLATLWPGGLSIARMPQTSWAWSGAGVALLGLFAVALRWLSGVAKWGIAAFVFLLLPGLLLPSVWGHADHATYLPHLGLVAAISFALPGPWLKGVAFPVVLFLPLSWVHLHHFAGTIPLLQQALAVDPANHEARLGLGLALAGEGKAVQAEKELRAVTQARPDSAIAWVGYARALTAQKKPADALRATEQALQKVPKSAEARFERGIALQNLNRVPEAEQSFIDALNAGLERRNGAIAYNNLGSYAAQRQDFARAEKFFEQAFLLDLGFALAHRNYAMSLVAQKQRAKAINHLQNKALLWTNNNQLVGEYLAALMNENYAEQYKKEQEQALREQELERKAMQERLAKGR